MNDSRSSNAHVAIRRLRPQDADVVAQLATYEGSADRGELLADSRTFLLAAFDGDACVGFVLAYELPRRHGERSLLFVYEVEVAPTHRRRGVGTALMRELERIARERGIRSGFVLTNERNAAAMAFYRSLGGRRPDDDEVLWDFTYADA